MSAPSCGNPADAPGPKRRREVEGRGSHRSRTRPPSSARPPGGGPTAARRPARSSGLLPAPVRSDDEGRAGHQRRGRGESSNSASGTAHAVELEAHRGAPAGEKPWTWRRRARTGCIREIYPRPTSFPARDHASFLPSASAAQSAVTMPAPTAEVSSLLKPCPRRRRARSRTPSPLSPTPPTPVSDLRARSAYLEARTADLYTGRCSRRSPWRRSRADDPPRGTSGRRRPSAACRSPELAVVAVVRSEVSLSNGFGGGGEPAR
jgi:hypothetical protein